MCLAHCLAQTTQAGGVDRREESVHSAIMSTLPLCKL